MTMAGPGMHGPLRCIGLMSGTSIDGVDGALVEFDEQGHLHRSLGLASIDMPEGLRAELTRLQKPGPDELALAARAGNALADLYAACVMRLLDQTGLHSEDIAAIGAHGQTVRHDPAAGYTLQILNGARLAEQTRIDVVCDLRSADVASGGQGAPLVPAFHARVFAPPAGRRRGILNIGGIANLSLIDTSAASADGAANVIGFDTGPGNTLLDSWCERHLGTRFDRDGRWAASGQADAALLQRLLADPYFGKPAPKSTGRDHFNLDWLNDQGQPPAGLRPEDIQATLLALTARSIADAVRAAQVDELYACGGGAFNRQMMAELQRAIGPAIPLKTTSALALDPMAVEATAFAWLARQRICRQAGNLPSVTGAQRLRVLGAVHARN